MVVLTVLSILVVALMTVRIEVVQLLHLVLLVLEEVLVEHQKVVVDGGIHLKRALQ